MSPDGALAAVLARLSDAQLAALAAACESCDRPPTGLVQLVAGASLASADAVAELASAWGVTPDLTGSGVALALRLGLRARQAADACRTRPVWTGPQTTGAQRLTSGVLHELIAGANERILLMSYAAYTLAEVASDLGAAVARGCTVDVVFETTEDSQGGYVGPANQPFGNVPALNRWRWPADRRTGDAVLHAKLLVIDGRRALVGSANLTAKALRHNLEVGVLIHDPVVAGMLEEHVRRLMSDGIVVRDRAG